jgi:hypothetical protein
MQSVKTSSGSELTIECTTIEFDNGDIASTAQTTVEVEPTYSSCEDFLGQDVAIDENGCDYIFHLNNSSTTGSVDLECPTEHSTSAERDTTQRALRVLVMMMPPSEYRFRPKDLFARAPNRAYCSAAKPAGRGSQALGPQERGPGSLPALPIPDGLGQVSR